jgi:hypothetical protein
MTSSARSESGAQGTRPRIQGRIPDLGVEARNIIRHRQAHSASNIRVSPGCSRWKPAAKRDFLLRPPMVLTGPLILPANPDFRIGFDGLPWDLSVK